MVVIIMHNRSGWWWISVEVLAVALVCFAAGTAYANTSSSTNFQVTEMEFGAGSSQQNCSGQYCATATIGEVSANDSASAHMAASFGAVTPDDPLLEMIVEPGVSNLGVLGAEKTATKTSIVRIRSYLSNGYTLQIVGDPPKYQGHTLATPATPTASAMGTEQFALNVVANTVPAVGVAPEQVPSAAISFGEPHASYATPNLFKYTSGDVIALSNSASGQTNYTISMIVNVSNTTPAGHYTSDFSAVVVPTY